ncbi:MAG: EAL domain-containing protein [Rhodocyclaceae bacterium]|nr:EAL domain-containing protein [Rhodocyclaceae bacterium]
MSAHNRRSPPEATRPAQFDDPEHALLARLLDLLGSAPGLTTDELSARLEEILMALPGVAKLGSEAMDTPREDATTLLLPLGDESQVHLALRVTIGDPTVFAPFREPLQAFRTVLRHLLEARRLGELAQQIEERTAELQNSEKRFRDLFDGSPDPCWLIDRGVFTDCNRAAIRILGYEDRDEMLQHPSRLSPEFQPDGRPSFEKAEQMMADAMREGITRFEWVHRRADGTCFPVEVTLARIELQGHDVLYCVWRDITDRKRAEEEAYNLAFFDPLTGLPNRRLLIDRLQQSMATSARSGKYRALLYLDLDRFKNLNDTLGHEIGDRLLVESARKLRTCVREGDTVARLGGDEFVVLIQQLDRNTGIAINQASGVAEKIIQALSQPCNLGPMIYQGTTSIGVALFVGQTLSVDELLKRADLAMYQAKAAGRNAMRFFDPDMQARVIARAALESELRGALERQEFTLHFQPQLDRAGRCIGAEALLRWHNPKRGRVSPAEFIPLAEESGLILPIGRWVLEEACRTLARWREDPATAALSIAVNVSARQFREQAFVAEVRACLDQSGVDPARLKLEITESMLLEDVEQTIETMLALKRLGVTFALDDFGTGYSSLHYVKRLPLDQLKIDQSFVRDILIDPNDAAICRAIIALGRSLGLPTMAEGVETEAQWAMLEQEGCDSAQGYLYARPMPEEEVLAWIRSRAA